MRIVLGPPGTGKTEKLLRFVEDELAKGTPSDRIGYVSFTTKAANEAGERARAKFKLAKDDLPYFSTLHSLCFRQLGMKRADVLSGSRLQEFADHVGVRISGGFSEDGTLTGFDAGDRIMFMVNLARIRLIPLRQQFDEFDDRLTWSEVSRVSRALAEFKKAHHLMDFTDMLTEFVRAKIRIRLKALFVDESQDLSPAQWRVVEQLAQGCENVAIAGDDDQAIYRWAGADVDHLIDLRGDVEVLGQSFRVPPVIQKLANRVITNVTKRREKQWKARTGGEGEIAREAAFDHVDCGAGQILVLARNTYILREQVEPYLRRSGIVYERHGHSSIRPTLLSAIRDWESLRKGGEIAIPEVRKIYELMTAGKGYRRGSKMLKEFDDEESVNLQQLEKVGGLLRKDPWHDALDRVPFGESDYIRAALARGEKITKKPRVVVSTIHGAKGGEADHVVLMKEIAGRSFREMQTNPQDEARVWYVGATRARERLTIVESSTNRRCPWI